MTSRRQTLPAGLSICMVLGFVCIAYLMFRAPGSVGRHVTAARSFPVSAQFNDIGSLKIGSPVKLAGVAVGRVVSIGLDTTAFQAAVGFAIDRRFERIPSDSSAAIRSTGVLGSSYVEITLGSSLEALESVGKLKNTKSAFNIERTVNSMFASLSARIGRPTPLATIH